MKKNPDLAVLTVARHAGGLWALMAVAPLALAQTPNPPPAANPPTAVAPPATAAAADTSAEHTGYLFGLTFGEQMHSVGITDQIDTAAVARGLKDGLHGTKSTRADQQQIQEYVRTTMAAAATRNKAAAKEFLEKNAKDKSVKTTPSGLQYKILTAGDAKAASPLASDEVSVNYRGKLLDGTEFDSSAAHGAAATFKIDGVIKGWQEALVLMKPGAKWQLFIPPELAYGDGPRPGIPSGSLLIFDVELLKVSAAAAAQSTPQASPPNHDTIPAHSHKAVDGSHVAAPAPQ